MITIENFKSGNFEKGFEYQYFIPTKINDQWVFQTMIISTLLEKAAVKLGELNSFSKLVPNIDLFIQSHVTKEAVLSSRIEGTQTKMEEAMMSIEDIAPERRDDWQEVSNYIRAMNMAIEKLQTLPISSRLIKKTHELLLDSVRGKHKMPGEFRTSQNWIGGNSLADAIFIPPAPQLVNELMSDVEKFLNNNSMPKLLKIAIAHYQFETIHPFLDGNGRIGRLLITLFLVSEKILDMPLLYLSTYFEKNKTLYYDNLMRVREKNDMLQWLKYFLVGIEQTATEAVNKLKAVLEMKFEIENNIHKDYERRAKYASMLINNLFREPIITVEDASKICGITFKSANDLITRMQTKNILKEFTGNSRNRIFGFLPYLDLFFNETHE